MQEKWEQVGRCHISKQQIRRTANVAISGDHIDNQHVPEDAEHNNRQEDGNFDRDVVPFAMHPNRVDERRIGVIVVLKANRFKTLNCKSELKTYGGNIVVVHQDRWLHFSCTLNTDTSLQCQLSYMAICRRDRYQKLALKHVYSLVDTLMRTEEKIILLIIELSFIGQNAKNK